MRNIVEDKSFQFAVRIVYLCKHLQENRKEYVLTKQIMRAATSIGANISEAQQAQSRADFAAKMNIALKECVETDYWLRLLHATDYLSDKAFQSMASDCTEIKKLLVSIVKTSNEN